jgi:tetratricopeptide (TPR) repeat protein
MKSIVALLACVLLSLAVVPSRADAQAATPTAEQRTRAREAYTRGQQLFDAGQFEQAQAAFEEAYSQVPNPVVLLGVASAQERRGLRAEARATLERYLRESPNARDRASIEQRIAALPAGGAATAGSGTTTSGATGTTTSGTTTSGSGATGTTTSGTTTSGSGTAGTTTSGTTTAGTTAGTSTTSSGTATSTSTTTSTETATTEAEAEAAQGEGAEGEAAEGEAAAAEGETAEEGTAEGEGAETPAPAPPAGPSTAVWVLTAVGAVGLVAGTVFGFMALSRQSDFDAAPTLSAADEGEAFALVADISFGVALAGGIAAIVLYATEGSGSASTDSASLQILPTLSPQGGGVVATGRF